MFENYVPKSLYWHKTIITNATLARYLLLFSMCVTDLSNTVLMIFLKCGRVYSANVRFFFENVRHQKVAFLYYEMKELVDIQYRVFLV